MKICHFSDHHGNYMQLPEADVYVCTGDLLPNFPNILFYNKWGREPIKWRANMKLFNEQTEHPQAQMIGRELDPEMEGSLQRRFIAQKGEGFMRDYLGTRGAPVIVCRGNHDFTDLAPAFGGVVYEIGMDGTKTFKIDGITFGGCRGINYIAGEWSDELVRSEFHDRVKTLSREIEVLITHAPPEGILDEYGHSFGSEALMSYVNERMLVGVELKAMLFGHIHEAQGMTTRGDAIFSNAATGFNEFEI